MIVFEVDTKVLDREIFSQHTVADLDSGDLNYCSVQSGEAITVKGNKHTQNPSASHSKLLFRIQLSFWLKVTFQIILKHIRQFISRKSLKLQNRLFADVLQNRCFKNFAIFIGKHQITQGFSCEYFNIFKSNFYYRTPLVTASSTYMIPW